MSDAERRESGWGSRRYYLMALLTQTLGTPTFVMLPNAAVTNGAIGYIIGYIGCFIVLGIPLVFMELVVSQYTARDCIDVWKARGCLSHIGYFLVAWQCFVVIYNHIINSFMVHYFLISFENPIPYYVCGDWRTNDCNILRRNHTINEDCLRSDEVPNYCDYLHTTYPEHQYWRNYLLGSKQTDSYYVAWRVCLASGLICIMMFLGCFKTKKSVKFIVSITTIYPLLGYLLFMTGSMVQKGLVMKYEEALDTHFTIFFEKKRISHIILQVIYSLGIGSGIQFNLAASSSFRTPCYSNTVIIVLICAAFSTLAVCTTAMMICPYAYEYKISTQRIMNTQLSLVFEKTTRLMYEYDYKRFWLILFFSCNSLLGIGTNVVIILNILEMIFSRYVNVSKYQRMTCFLGMTFVFFISIPLFGYYGISAVVGFRRIVYYFTLFVAILECLVFILWYGLGRFSEDVHFMEGIKLRNYIKIGLFVAIFVLGYIFFNELYNRVKNSKQTLGDKIGFYSLISWFAMILIIFLVKLLVAIFKKKVVELITLDPTWGPKSEVLQRSRAMFSAQAMTKEYMYRQYHLQAGILQRQRISNSRTTCVNTTDVII